MKSASAADAPGIILQMRRRIDDFLDDLIRVPIVEQSDFKTPGKHSSSWRNSPDHDILILVDAGIVFMTSVVPWLKSVFALSIRHVLSDRMEVL